jgi:hypothetical protein
MKRIVLMVGENGDCNEQPDSFFSTQLHLTRELSGRGGADEQLRRVR